MQCFVLLSPVINSCSVTEMMHVALLFMNQHRFSFIYNIYMCDIVTDLSGCINIATVSGEWYYIYIISVTLHELMIGESRTKHYMRAALLLQKMHMWLHCMPQILNEKGTHIFTGVPFDYQCMFFYPDTCMIVNETSVKSKALFSRIQNNLDLGQ